MHCNKKPFYLKSNGVDSSTMDAYIMHTVSFTISFWSCYFEYLMVLTKLQNVLLFQLHHVHRTRDVVIRNDAKLRNDADRDISDDNTYLDQGFTRPKVYHIKNVEILSICSVAMETLTGTALLKKF